MKNISGIPLEEQIVIVLCNDYENLDEEKAKKLVEDNADIILEAKKYDSFPFYPAGLIAKKENLIPKFILDAQQEEEL